MSFPFKFIVKLSLNIVYAMIPHGLAIADWFSGVPSIAVLTYRSELYTIGVQSVCADDSLIVFPFSCAVLIDLA